MNGDAFVLHTEVHLNGNVFAYAGDLLIIDLLAQLQQRYPHIKSLKRP